MVAHAEQSPFYTPETGPSSQAQREAAIVAAAEQVLAQGVTDSEAIHQAMRAAAIAHLGRNPRGRHEQGLREIHPP